MGRDFKVFILGVFNKIRDGKIFKSCKYRKNWKIWAFRNAALSAINKTTLLNSAQSALFTLNNSNNEKFASIVTNLFKVHPAFAELYVTKTEKEEELNKAKEALK